VCLLFLFKAFRKCLKGLKVAWIEYHEAVRDLWKIRRLSKLCSVRYAEAMGWISALWLWSVSNARDGSLKKFSDDEICAASLCESRKKVTKKMLIECELLDHDERIHDWRKHGVSYLESHRKSQKKYRSRKDNSDITTISQFHINQPDQPTRPTKPTIENIRAYFLDKKSTKEEAEKFFNFYESNGWKVGKNPMKNWRAAASGWISRNNDFSKQQTPKKPAFKRCWVCTTDIPEAEFMTHFRKHEAERERKNNAPQSAGSILQSMTQKKEVV